LVPVMALAQQAGLSELVDERVRLGRPCGVNAHVKVPCLVAGMIAGADSIDDMGLLRHGAMPAVFGGVRAPSTLGSFLPAFTWGNVLQLEKVSRLVLAELARRTPLLPGAAPSPSSISTRSRSGSMAGRSRARRSATRRSRARACSCAG
jgi:hypothetical protein